MWPVFVFGTGRCGSTYLQRLITVSTCCWIWGEHDGFLRPLLKSLTLFETSQTLKRAVFDAGPRGDDQLISEMTHGSEGLAWLNRFEQAGFRTELASLVDRMFRTVPVGWTCWGFKEIRYGLDNNAPAILLDLFPTSTAVFTFREPKSTIESMVRTWGRSTPENEPQSLDSLAEDYRNAVSTWRKIVTYFLEYREQFGRPIVFLSGDKLNRGTEEILQALRLPVTRAISCDLGVTNLGPSWPQWVRARFDELYENDSAECLGLFTRACAASDADFTR